MKNPILLVEDEEDDVFFFRRAMTRADFCHPLNVVRDGREAIEYLAGEGKFVERTEFPPPCLVVLDLNLPQRHGLEVLQWIRRHGPDPIVPVVILTSSTSEKDVAEAFRHGVSSYLSKPPQQDKLVDLVRMLRAFVLEAKPLPACRPDPAG